MSNPLKKLAGQTAIYGLPSIVGRLLNYLLVPLHTAVFVPQQFGIITEMYSYVAFLVVLLAFGMETAFFRFMTKEDKDKNAVFSSIIIGMIFTTAFFVVASLVFDQQIANWLQYPDNSEYVVWFALIMGLDALSAIPMARLRQEEKAKQFAAVNIANILVNIGLNVFFLGYLWPKGMAGESNWLVDTMFNQEIGVGYVFIANLIASGCKFLLLTPVMFKARAKFQFELLRDMFVYGAPMLIGNLAITVNEVIDKPMIKYLVSSDQGAILAQEQVGIYGACAKLAILMSMFVQAFRYAAEPFFFNKEKDSDAKQVYATVMKYFVLICTVVFIGVVLGMDILKYFIQNQAYWEGLAVVPILLLAYICYGMFYNLSVWYKLGGKTIYGAYIPLIGAGITIVLNLWWIPIYGYMGSAWATLIAYGVMVIVSYLLGQKHYPIKYPVGKLLIYIAIAVGIVYLFNPIAEITATGREYEEINWVGVGLNVTVLLGYVGLIYVLEIRKKRVT